MDTVTLGSYCGRLNPGGRLFADDNGNVSRRSIITDSARIPTPGQPDECGCPHN
ncbi:MAG TPA: hypothetical protein VJ938_01430 [Acidimicrobiia bacterium]|nr:hypothetical protein [Acidimicrobiia bacterium]